MVPLSVGARLWMRVFMNTQQGSILGAFAVTMLAMAAHDNWVQQFIGWVGTAPGGSVSQSGAAGTGAGFQTPTTTLPSGASPTYGPEYTPQQPNPYGPEYTPQEPAP